MPDSESDGGSATTLEQSDLSDGPFSEDGLWRYNTHYVCGPYENDERPDVLNTLAAFLLRFPDELEFAEIDQHNTPEKLLAVIETVPRGDIAELEAALHRATLLTPEVITKCQHLGTRSHLRILTTPTFNAVFQSAWEADELTWCSGAPWTSAKELSYLRDAKQLRMPSPDETIGLGYTRESRDAQHHDADVLSRGVLQWLYYNCHPRIVYDPCGASRTSYPAFIYQAGSPDDGNEPRAKVAIAAMEALTMLEHLCKISNIPSRQPMVILATSTNMCWHFYVATKCECSGLDVVSGIPVDAMWKSMFSRLTQQVNATYLFCRTCMALLHLVFNSTVCRTD